MKPNKNIMELATSTLILVFIAILLIVGSIFLSVSSYVNALENNILAQNDPGVSLSGTTPTMLFTASEPGTQKDYFKRDFNISNLGNSKQDSAILYGYELIANTNKYIGPDNGNQKMIYAGNNLNCKSCHLDAGTRPFSAPYVGVYGRFPQYRGRENKIGSLEERINGCMQRSMNGRPLPENGPEMRAMIAYMNWVSKAVPTGEKVVGSGFKSIEIPNRKVDLKQGENIYQTKCASCHQTNGLGTQNPQGGYIYPPLAGEDTYNDGAGMHRVLTAAQFIKYNMPFGVTADNPQLSDEEAYDVAGYINTFDRPKKKQTQKDFPDLKRKPVSTPYGPWVDPFPAEQHKFGPFPEIMDWYQKEYNMTKTK